MINKTAIYVLWLREMKRFIRSRSRVIGTISMPLFFLIFMGMGFRRINMPGLKGIEYITFLVPGMIGMSLLATSTFAGFSVLWDKEFGFLKEIMVAPVNRISIVLGRIAGGATTSILQATTILIISLLFGFRINNISSIIFSILFMIIISITFIGLGLALASQMTDIQGFHIIMQFIVFPLFFLSGALYPIENLPLWIRSLTYIDPLTYGVDGLRSILIGKSSFPLFIDIIVMLVCSLSMVALGAYLFDKSNSL